MALASNHPLQKRIAELEQKLEDAKAENRELLSLFDAPTAELAALEKWLRLTPQQSVVLHHLVKNAGRTATRRQLEFLLHGGDVEKNAYGVVKVQICRLRTALRMKGHGNAILTMPGGGYRMDLDVAHQIAKLQTGSGENAATRSTLCLQIRKLTEDGVPRTAPEIALAVSDSRVHNLLNYLTSTRQVLRSVDPKTGRFVYTRGPYTPGKRKKRNAEPASQP
jgi:DNA-binding winged helix-turn-helix (wHTH) protein